MEQNRDEKGRFAEGDGGRGTSYGQLRPLKNAWAAAVPGPDVSGAGQWGPGTPYANRVEAVRAAHAAIMNGQRAEQANGGMPQQPSKAAQAHMDALAAGSHNTMEARAEGRAVRTEEKAFQKQSLAKKAALLDMTPKAYRKTEALMKKLSSKPMPTKEDRAAYWKKFGK